jgi:hypothetical protein
VAGDLPSKPVTQKLKHVLCCYMFMVAKQCHCRVFELNKVCSKSRANLHVEPKTCRHKTANIDINKGKVCNLLPIDRRFTTSLISEMINMNQEYVCRFWIDVFGMNKVCSTTMANVLKVNQ